MISLPAKAAVLVNAVAPGAVAQAMTIANRSLPAGGGGAGDRARSGWDSSSEYAPPKITTLADRAAAENNEVPRARARASPVAAPGNASRSAAIVDRQGRSTT